MMYTQVIFLPLMIIQGDGEKLEIVIDHNNTRRGPPRWAQRHLGHFKREGNHHVKRIPIER
jgi:hypothetical protein